MADQAHVTSVEALERFRSSLIRYQERAAAVLHEISEEVNRTRHWVDQDRMPFWKMEIRRQTRALNETQQRLFSAELSEFRETVSEEKRDMLRAREQLREAEEKARATKKWSQNYDSTVAPLAKHVDRLRGIVEEDLPQAIHQITEMIKTLEDYGEVRAKPAENRLPESAPPSPGSGGPGPAAESAGSNDGGASSDLDSEAS